MNVKIHFKIKQKDIQRELKKIEQKKVIHSSSNLI